jgi:serine/threonine protein kinase
MISPAHSRLARLAAEPALPPATFPLTQRYRYVRKLGRGGMGMVYEAFDVEHGHSVALKTALGRTDASIGMLVNEFRTRRVSHPNLVRLLELTVEEDQTFFTMELLEATDLAHWVWESDPICFLSTMSLGDGETGAISHPSVVIPSPPRLSPERTRALARICCDLGSALHALHRGGLVHCDVKPNNILVTDAGRVVLADFGLTTAFRPAPGEPRAGARIAGTPGYMAPEQLEGRPSPASDFYALGATIVHAITGAPPPDPSHGSSILARVCNDERLVVLVEAMLAGDELERPCAEDIVEQLAVIADAPVTATTSSRAWAQQ